MPTPPGVADVSVGYIQTGMSRAAFITFGVDPTDTNPAVINASVFNAVTAAGSLNSQMDATATLSRIRVSLGTDGQGDIVSDIAYTTAGGRTLTSSPPNVALLVHKRTAAGGRRGRGRLFIPFCLATADISESGIVQTSQVTTLQTAMNAFLTALTTQTVPMVLLHQTGLTPIGAPTAVTSLTVDKLVSTQRRRLGR